MLGAALWALPQAAAAQGLLDLIFGAPKPPPIDLPMPRPIRALPMPGSGGALSSDGQRAIIDGEGDGGGTYRTVCVRMCDGFFVPMSFSTTRKNFMADQAKCRATCGDDARLFFHRNPGGGMEEALDMSGRVYGRLPTAFRFRKALVDGCACRPPPWSDAERLRHRAYAEGPQTPVVDPPPTAAAKMASGGPGAPADPLAKADSVVVPAKSVLQAAKSRGVPQKRAMPAEVPVAVRSVPNQRPKTAPPQQAAGSGLFGLGSASGMGLGVKPKYVWPGD
jgi:hypothetical protein